jgi:NADH-quinone oxidoreductase subunit G
VGATVSITIDGRVTEVRAGQWIIDAAEEAGVYIPRFCYHPRMRPVGMCRMCLVEVEGPRGPSLVPACYNPVSDGMVIETASVKAKKAQEGVLELLLVNHPLDCPVCDKGGECPLQDQTLAYGPGESRFVEEKRHWEKPIAISELVNLDRERCIQCGRCVRFADEVAGDPLIDFADRGDKTEVATFPGEPYSSYFSGNVVQICPVGALTSKPYRFRARPWDLQQVESTCTTCSVGCRAAVQSSSGELTRLIGVDSDPVNWGWLCDKGRFAFPTSASDGRIRTPLVREGDELVGTTWADALARAAAGLADAKRRGGGPSLAVIGGARLTNEDAFVWSKVARLALGTDNVDAQIGDGVPAETLLALPRATIDEACAAPLVITVAADIKDELPVLYLRLRHAVREKGLQLLEVTPAPGGLTRHAAESLVYRPGGLPTVAAALTGPAGPQGPVAGVPVEALLSARAHIARAREVAGPEVRPVVVILGRPSLAESPEHAANAALHLASIPGVSFLSALRRGNVNGALDMGLAPGVLPGRVSLEDGRQWYEHHWSADLPAGAGLDTTGILGAAARGHIGGLVLLGADPVADFPDSTAAIKGLLGARFVVAVDTHLTESARRADVVLPAAAWAERRGSFTNIEGRITWLGQLVTDRGVAWPDWMIASELAARLGLDLGYSDIDDVWAEITRVSPLHQGVGAAILFGPRARDGVVVPSGPDGPGPVLPRPLDPMADPGISSAERYTVAPTAIAVTDGIRSPEKAVEPVGPQERDDVPAGDADGAGDETLGEATTGEAQADASGTDDEQPPAMPAALSLRPSDPGALRDAEPGEDSGSLRLVTRRTMWDAGTQVQAHPMLAGLAPEPRLRVSPAVLADVGAAEGETVTLRSANGRVDIPAVSDTRLPEGSAALDWNLPGVRVGDLIDASRPFTEITLHAEEGGGSDG